MTTDPFSDIGFNQEIGQPTYVELITAERRTGKAVRTICDETTGELVCDDGPSPTIRLRDLAFKKQTVATPIKPNKKFVAVQASIPNRVQGNQAEYRLDDDAALRAQSFKAQKIQSEFHDLVANHGLIVPMDWEVSSEDIVSDSCRVYDVSSKFEWRGTVRQPVNIFQIFVEYKLRDPDDPTKFGYVYQMPIDSNHLNGCDFWAQEGDGGMVVSNPLLPPNSNLTSSISDGDLATLDSNENFVWAVPFSETTSTQDFLQTRFPRPEQNVATRVVSGDTTCTRHEDESGYKECIVESITFFALMNRIDPPDSPGTGATINLIPTAQNDSVTAPGWAVLPADTGCLTTPILYTYLIDDTDYIRRCQWSGIGVNHTEEQIRLSDPDFIDPNYGTPLDAIITFEFGDMPPEASDPFKIVVKDSVGNQYFSKEFTPTEYEDLRISKIFTTTFRTFPASYTPVESDYIYDVTISGIPESTTPDGGFVWISVGISITHSEIGSGCSPDPASEFDLILDYKRYPSTVKSFSQTTNKSALYQQEVDNTSGWTRGSVGSGVPGEIARWETFAFVLDTDGGSGIDQCSESEGDSFIATGEGTLVFSKFGLEGDEAFFLEPCIPTVVVQVTQEGEAINEIQSIVLPTPEAGTYKMEVTINGITQITDPIPYEADADQLRVKIGRLTNVGGPRNVIVSGSGTELDPFIVEFIDFLSAVDIDRMVGDTTNLVGTASAVFRTIRSGTLNERQRLTRGSDTAQPYRLVFNGETTIELAFDSSLNVIQAAMEGLATIGTGNISVTGETTDRESPYEGVVLFDFIGDFAGQNVPEIDVISGGDYTASVDWNGGVGVDEIQELTISGTTGTFTITVYDPSDATNSTFAITGNIAWNATAATLKSAIVSAASWINSTDLVVTKPADNQWRIQFVNNLGKSNIKQSEIDARNLGGSTIVVNTIQNGSGTRERQRVSLLNVTSGTFQLQVTIPRSDAVQTTDPIQFDATADDLKLALEALPGLSEGDISVSGDSPTWLVVFRAGLGNVVRMEPLTDDLECDPAAIRPVSKPPYKYELPKPNTGSPLPEKSPLQPLRDSANVFTQTILQRFLFDPNLKIDGERKTLRQLALVKGINPNDYNPYLRACDNSRLLDASYSAQVNTQESYVLISKEIDSEQEQQRILSHIRSHREILPARFSWDCLEI